MLFIIKYRMPTLQVGDKASLFTPSSLFIFFSFPSLLRIIQIKSKASKVVAVVGCETKISHDKIATPIQISALLNNLMFHFDIRECGYCDGIALFCTVESK